MPACIPCAPGQYTNTTNSTSCIACPAGHVAAWLPNATYQSWNTTQLSYFQVSTAETLQ